MATEDKRIDQLDPVSVLDLTSLMAMQQGTNAKKVTLQQLLDYLNAQIGTGNAVLFVSQKLSDAQQKQARENIGAAASGEGGGGTLEGAVLYTEQTLTEEQQCQARKNIKCGSLGEVSQNSTASGDYSHAEGYNTKAPGSTGSHAEGYNTTASGAYGSHAEGYRAKAEGWDGSHAEGFYTIARRRAQHVQGRYNVEDIEGSNTDSYGKYAHIVGNGTAADARSNAHTLDWDGVPWFAGDRVMLGGTGMDDEAAVTLMPIFVAQELTEEQKLQARTNIGAMAKGDTEVKVTSKAYLNSYKIVVTVNGVESEGPAMSLVRYDVNQTGLTEEQKAQARANIGVDAYIEQVFLGGEW